MWAIKIYMWYFAVCCDLYHFDLGWNTKSESLWLMRIWSLFETVQSIFYKTACAPSEDANQPAHPRTLIRIFAVRLKMLRIHAYPQNTMIWVFAGPKCEVDVSKNVCALAHICTHKGPDQTAQPHSISMAFVVAISSDVARAEAFSRQVGKKSWKILSSIAKLLLK